MLERGYSPKGLEEKWYEHWVSKGYFKPDPNSKKGVYSIVIPPPNITGSLHMGHALNAVLQDVLSRWKRMLGYKVLWLPGTDHAGIATQNVVEKQLTSEGLNRHNLGREAFLERVWKWKTESGGTIIHQLKRLGASCDWSRERFTLDEGLSKAVREVFVRLYEEGLIYRENRLINWCYRCHTALSDLEVEHEELEGRLTYIKYPLSDKSGYITVATTRPETMLGDTAVAVHPDDGRYKDVIGKTVDLPLTTRRISIISDNAVDPSFGTGAVKITPAHDFNDEAIAKKQNPPLEFVTVIGKDARMTEEAGKKYEGMDRYECRKHVLADLKKKRLIVKDEKYKHSIGVCYRCKTVIEPLLTLQWYVNVKPLAEDAIQSVRDGRISFVPKSWENTYFAWMENIRDWCISRQIWWGHRIPAWYCQEKKNEECRKRDGIIVSREKPKECPYCSSQELVQDEDVLDTWFSSALWPFSTLGWPEKTADLEDFYPTSVLVTGFDIIFFWVARMIMMGLKFMGEVPFREVYIHALVRDVKGQKMSKSKGNVIDPLIMMEKYGTDAFRFTLAAFAAQGRDVKFSEERVEGYRHFVNKLWNAARFIMMNMKEVEAQSITGQGPEHINLASKWILSRLSYAADNVNKALEEYRFNDAANDIYQFIWHEFCDWYIEMAKSDIQKPDLTFGILRCLLYTLDVSLRLLHPFMPYITEEIWQTIKNWNLQIGSKFLTYEKQEMKENIMISDYAMFLQRYHQAEEDMSYIIEAINGIRTIRGELNIHPSLKVHVSIKTYSQKAKRILKENVLYIKKLAKTEEVTIGEEIDKPEGSATCIKSSLELYVPLRKILNIEVELERLKKDEAKVNESISFIRKKLRNRDFLQMAPAEVVEKEKEKYEVLILRKERITESIKQLKEAGGEK